MGQSSKVAVESIRMNCRGNNRPQPKSTYARPLLSIGIFRPSPNLSPLLTVPFLRSSTRAPCQHQSLSQDPAHPVETLLPVSHQPPALHIPAPDLGHHCSPQLDQIFSRCNFCAFFSCGSANLQYYFHSNNLYYPCVSYLHSVWWIRFVHSIPPPNRSSRPRIDLDCRLQANTRLPDNRHSRSYHARRHQAVTLIPTTCSPSHTNILPLPSSLRSRILCLLGSEWRAD